MIVCKIYVDVIDGEECIVTELAKKNIPEHVTNLGDISTDRIDPKTFNGDFDDSFLNK